MTNEDYLNRATKKCGDPKPGDMQMVKADAALMALENMRKSYEKKIKKIRK